VTAHLDLEARQSRYAALHLWRADSLAKLCSRDLTADMSAAVVKRLLQHQTDFAAVDATL